MTTLLDSKPPVVWEPFPHVVVRGALPKREYSALADGFPPQSMFRDKWETNNVRVDLPQGGVQLTKYTKAWREFITAHLSVTFWQRVWDVFGPVIATVRPALNAQSGVGRRGQKGIVNLSCGAGINTPVKVKSSVRGPHIDKPNKIITGLFYLPVDRDYAGGDLVLYRATGPVQFGELRSVTNPEVLEPVVTVPYAPNTAVFYVNGPLSIHGVTERDVTPHPRRLAAIGVFA